MAKNDDKLGNLGKPNSVLSIFDQDKDKATNNSDSATKKTSSEVDARLVNKLTNIASGKSNASNSNESDSQNNEAPSETNSSDSKSGVDSGLKNELGKEETQEKAAQQAMIDEKMKAQAAEQGMDVGNDDSDAQSSASNSNSSSSSDTSESSTANNTSSSNINTESESSSTDDSDDNTESKTITFNGKTYPRFNIVKQIPLKDFHTFDVGLQRAYLSHQDLIKDIKHIQNNNFKATSKDFTHIIRDDTRVFQNLCDTIYTNRKNFDEYMDNISNMLQDTKDKANKGNDTIQKWKDNGIFANIEPYLKIIAKVAQDPRFQQMAGKLDTKQITPTKTLHSEYTTDKQKLDQIQAQNAKQGKQNNNNDNN